MLGTTTPPGETQAMTSWVGKIHPRGFVREKAKRPDQNPNTLNRWTYLVTLLMMKGTGQNIGSKKCKRT
jgi:hypothetical protein